MIGFTPSAGDTLVMSNGDILEIRTHLNHKTNRWLFEVYLIVYSKKAEETVQLRYTMEETKQDWVVMSINPSYIVYAYQ